MTTPEAVEAVRKAIRAELSIFGCAGEYCDASIENVQEAAQAAITAHLKWMEENGYRVTAAKDPA